MKFITFLILTTLFLSSCIFDKSQLNVSIKKDNITINGIDNTSVSSVRIINNQLIINGKGLTAVQKIKVNGHSLDKDFIIESVTTTEIIANSLSLVSFDVSKVFNLILSDANASATFAIDFSLCNSSLNGKGFDCNAPISDKDVLSYDGVSGKWKPRAVAGLNYIGTFDASANPLLGPLTLPAGAYYIISRDGTIASTPFKTGDWLVSNGSSWQKIDLSTAVRSVFGRSGNIIAKSGDYNLSMLGDVKFPIAPVIGNVLKFDGDGWVAGDDLSGGGSGSVNTTEIADSAVTDIKILSVAASKITGTITSAQIADGSIVNADINAAAGIKYTKLDIADGEIPYAKLNIVNGAIPAAKITGLPVLTTILAASVIDNDTTHAPSGEAVYEELRNKLGVGGGTLSIGTIRGVPAPFNDDDIVNKFYVDTKHNLALLKAGGTMTGPLTLNNDLKIKGGSNYVTIQGNPSSLTYNLMLPISKGTIGQVLKSEGDGSTTWTDAAPLLGFTPINKAGDTILSGTFTFDGAASLKVKDPDAATDVVNKRYLETFGQWSKDGTDIYRLSNVGIGISNPSAKLQIQDGRIYVGGASGFYQVGQDTNDSNFSKIAFHNSSVNSEDRHFIGLKYSNGAGSLSVGGGDSLNLFLDSGANPTYGSHIFRKTGWNGAIRTYVESMRLDKDGNLGIGTNAPSEKLEVTGNVKAVSYLYTSDRRLKSNIETIDDSLIKILSLRGVEFDWNKTGDHEIGLIAQEVEEVEPNLVTTSAVDGMKAVKYGNIVALLIEAMKAEHKIILKNQMTLTLMQSGIKIIEQRTSKLEREVASLKEENAKLKNDLEKIKKYLKIK